MLRHFEDNDEAYLKAIHDEPTSFVGNMSASLRPDYFVIHKATCRSINAKSGVQEVGAFTARQYRKVFGSRAEVLQWAEEKGFIDPRACGKCLPVRNSDTPRTGAGAAVSDASLTVANEGDLAAGLDAFWSGSSKSSSDHEKFLALLKRGKNFVSSADGERMAPSRFVGYAGNTLTEHVKRVDVDGGVSDAAISSILGKKQVDASLEAAYLRICDSFGITPHKNARLYWVLPLIKLGSSAPLAAGSVDFDAAVQNSLSLDPAARSLRLAQAPKKPDVRTTTVQVFIRNPDVVAEVLIRANGFCELCELPAPFMRASDATPYLEVHHRIRLADDGDDTVENALALCPNCHRKQHHG